MQPFTATVRDLLGRAVAAAPVTLSYDGGGLVPGPSVFAADGVTVLGNPFETDPSGTIALRAADGIYSASIATPNGTIVLKFQLLAVTTISAALAAATAAAASAAAAAASAASVALPYRKKFNTNALPWVLDHAISQSISQIFIDSLHVDPTTATIDNTTPSAPKITSLGYDPTLYGTYAWVYWK